MYYFTQEKPFANVDVMQVKFDSRGGAQASPSTYISIHGYLNVT